MQFWKYRDRKVVSEPYVQADPSPSDADVRDAYKKGRQDEKARRKSHPILALVVFALALVGAVMLFLAMREGSFSGAGKAADANIAVAAAEAPGVARNAATEVGEAARNATDDNPRT